MSWDFHMCVNVGTETEPKFTRLGDFYGANYTYNVSPMFCDAFDADNGIRSLHHKRGDECAPLLDAAIAKFEADPAKYEAMNPPNKWGDSTGALNLLRTLRRWCDEAPGALMEVS